MVARGVSTNPSLYIARPVAGKIGQTSSFSTPPCTALLHDLRCTARRVLRPSLPERRGRTGKQLCKTKSFIETDSFLRVLTCFDSVWLPGLVSLVTQVSNKKHLSNALVSVYPLTTCVQSYWTGGLCCAGRDLLGTKHQQGRLHT